MKRLISIIFMLVCLLAYGNADYFTVTINGVEWETVCPLTYGAFSLDYLPAGTHSCSIEPHLYTDHISVPVNFVINKKENKKFEFWEMIPQPGDEEYFDSTLLKLKEKK